MGQYVLYSSGTGSATADIRETDEIVAVDIDIDVTTPTAGQSGLAELSFGSASQFATNDANGVIASNRVTVATAVGETTARKTISGLSIPVNAGERLFLHTDKGTHTAQVARCVVYTRGRKRPTAARR